MSLKDYGFKKGQSKLTGNAVWEDAWHDARRNDPPLTSDNTTLQCPPHSMRALWQRLASRVKHSLLTLLNFTPVDISETISY